MKRIIFLTIMLILSLLTWPTLAGDNYASGVTAMDDWREALARQSDLGEREKQLVSELMAWNVRIDSARRERDRLQQEIQGIDQALAAAQDGIADNQVRLDKGMDRLGRWVNFLYRHGPVSYLEVLLGATDFNDFVERAEAVRIVIFRQSAMLDEMKAIKTNLQEQVVELSRLGEEKSQKNMSLAVSLKNMEESRAGREEFLKSLNSESADLAQRITRVEKTLWGSLDSLNYLMTNIDKLPWYSLTPDNLSLGWNRMRMEFSDGQVNRVLFQQAEQSLAGLSIRCTPGLFTISGRLKAGGGDFVLGGNFVPDGEGKVRFKPENIILAGLPVSREAINQIASENRLSFEFAGYLPDYSLVEVRAEENKLVVLLADKRYLTNQ